MTIMRMYTSCLISLVVVSISCSSSLKKPKLHTVEIRDMKFVPGDLTVQIGDTVRWINRDFIAHDVTEQGNQGGTSPVIVAGDSSEREITAAFQYYCSLHLVMKGQIRVE